MRRRFNGSKKEDWEYVCDFELIPEIHKLPVVKLVFKGLDTYAEVSLNGQKLFSSNNMFIPWEHDVKNILRDGINELKVLFHSPFLMGLDRYKRLPYQLPANNDEHEFRVSPFTRKAPYMYGWDWGPRLLTSGIWKDIFVEGSEKACLNGIRIRLLSLSPAEAQISADISVRCTVAGQYTLRVFIDNTEAAVLTSVFSEGVTERQMIVKIRKPRLWWPKGFGDPALYSVRVSLSGKDRIYDETLTDTGIRTAELITVPDKDGHTFHFRINGKDVFIRGANIIPSDYFVSRIKEKDYEELTDNAVAVNMNMLRAWGGGIYEDDHFYRLCDRKGIMVWQDFMFACGMYPSDDEFLGLIGREVRHHVARLRNHPSLVLWCGNNEIFEGFHTWGWKDELGNAADEAYQSYLKIFNEFIPGILKEMDPSRPWWPTSPWAGSDNLPNLKSGDFHFWDIVKKIQPVTVYSENIGRFMSEYGFKSYPDPETIASFAGQGNPDIHSEIMEEHQGWPGGAELVEKNLEWFYVRPADPRHFSYLSQLLQAFAIKGAIEAHRRAKPYCMGSLYWQLNDCWPSATWSGIDYFGRWKALHYHLKTAFSDILLSAEMNDGDLMIRLISDLPEPVPVMVNLRILDFSGNEIFLRNIRETADPVKAIPIFSAGLQDLVPGVGSDRILLDMNIYRKDHLLSHNRFYFVRPHDLKLDEPGLEIKSERVFDKTFLFLHSRSLVKNLFISHLGCNGFFSDNFFDLMPGEEKIIIFQSENRNPDPGGFTYLSLYDVFKKHREEKDPGGDRITYE